MYPIPLIIYSVLGPPDDPLYQFLPPDFHTPAIREYVSVLCKPRVLLLDQAACCSLQDMEDITQQLLDQLQHQHQHQPPAICNVAIAYYQAYQRNLLPHQATLELTIKTFANTYITNRNGRHHSQWFSLSPIGCLRHCSTIQQFSPTHCLRTEADVETVCC